MEDVIFGPEDTEMLDHIVDVIGDRMRSEDGYTEGAEATLTKLERLRDATKTKSLLVVALVIIPAEEPDPTVCEDADGHTYPEHDYGESECHRCGAEPDDLA